MSPLGQCCWYLPVLEWTIPGSEIFDMLWVMVITEDEIMDEFTATQGRYLAVIYTRNSNASSVTGSTLASTGIIKFGRTGSRTPFERSRIRASFETFVSLHYNTATNGTCDCRIRTLQSRKH
jgi:hypothetical protein